MINFKHFCLSLFFSIIVATQPVSAENFTLVDGDLFKAATVTGGTDTAQILVSSGRSYCCEIFAPMSELSVSRFSTVTGSQGSGTLSVSDRGIAKPVVVFAAGGMGGVGFAKAARKCFTWEDSGNSINRINLPILIGGAGNDSLADVSMICRETTLYGGYNTVVTDFNFIEIINTLISSPNEDGTVNVVLKANASIAGQENVIDTSFAILAGGRRDFDVHSLVPSDFGPISITHDGPPGAIRARIVQYRIDSVSPLVFTPVSVEVFRVGSAS